MLPSCTLCPIARLLSSSGPEELTFTAYPGVSYFVVVDGWSFHTGPYNLQVTCN